MTIKLTIRLFGALRSGVPGYDHAAGMNIDAQDGATPEDVLRDLQIPTSHIGLISFGNTSIQLDTPLADGMVINFFSLVSGG